LGAGDELGSRCRLGAGDELGTGYFGCLWVVEWNGDRLVGF
jgi:hypothetical protein